MKTLKLVLKKLRYSVIPMGITLMASFQTVLADGNEYAEKGATWVLDGIFWIVLCATVFSMGMAAVKRNLSGALISGLVGAIVLVVIKEPNVLTSLGGVLKGIIGL